MSWCQIQNLSVRTHCDFANLEGFGSVRFENTVKTTDTLCVSVSSWQQEKKVAEHDILNKWTSLDQ